MIQYGHNLIAATALVLLFGFSLGATLKTIYHTWFLVTGIRHEKRLTASLMGPFCLLVPALFEDAALPHLKRLNFWLPVTLILYAAIFGMETLLA